MSLQRFSIRNFRNLESLDCQLAPRFTVFWGANGAGKTNILEALYFLSTLRSFRVSEQALLIRNEETITQLASRRLDPQTELHDDLKIKLTKSDRGCRKTIYLNDKHQKSAASVYGRLPAILFTPEDLSVIRGSPSARRQFLDRVLFAQDRNHITDIQQYDKLLRSRNRLLKQQGAVQRDANLFDTYEEGLATIGAKIWTRRVELCLNIEADFHRYYAQIQGTKAQEQPVKLSYQAKIWPQRASEIPAEPYSLLREALKEGRQEHAFRGSTRIGPHLDDLVFLYQNVKAPNIASQGQLRAMVLAFKVAELDLAKSRGQEPILLLDDVSSEFDPTRNAHLFELISTRVNQCVVTTTDPKFLKITPQDREDHQIKQGRLIA